MPQWPVSANNAILVSGIPLEHEYEAGEATIWPGMGVTIDTTNKWEAIMCDDGDNVKCIVDVSMASVTGRGSWRYDSVHGHGTTTPKPLNEGDQFKCISGPVTVMLLLATGQEIDEGDKLQCVGSGMFGAHQCLTDSHCALVAMAMEAVTTVTNPAYIHAQLE